MKIHEYQAKDLLRAAGVPVPRGRVVNSPEEARAAYEELGSGLAVVKAQVHAGGRGKGGGVRLVRSAEEAERAAREILSKPLVTPQTGPEGVAVRRLLVEEGTAIERELYAGLAVDRSLGRPVLMASKEGGVEIEEVAARDPAAIVREPVDPALGLFAFQGRKLARALDLPRSSWGRAVEVFEALARLFLERDASLAEINPLVLTREGEILALDAKMNFDDNALFRQPEIAAMRDLEEEDPREVEASKYGLSYIALDGDIGCMVNGAGLAMATMDIIKLHGGEPANFLDVGGGATAEQVREAFRIVLQDPGVRAVLVNIFGGIMRCDVIAKGIVEAAAVEEVRVPLVVRLEGTKVEEGREILEQSGLRLVTADGMEDAARKVVAAARGGAA